ncbi:MAG TPA: 3-deoxy-D-manno-octulosonic acid transferase [Candidatus Omnitrophota bacterium]|nr:3-deoxy-D-manno-octulosonic acid transferase [Candidatus Omnitrophota bacterium]HPS19831.1 3-deoxy-D-manno-octulosonic acid transferase [Candidatus Omnitrophota bacterium]
MRFLFDVFFMMFSVVYLPYLFLGRRMHKDFKQRFGYLPAEATSFKKPVWIHAVSVGEAQVALELAAKLKKEMKDVPVVVSVTTKTGYALLSQWAGKTVDAVFYSPIDISWIVARVIRKIDPRVYVMIETEIWPNILTALRRNKVPIVLANGRISDFSFNNYRTIRFLIKGVFENINVACMQSQKDVERIIALGIPEKRCFVTGNMKFDMAGGGMGEGISKKDIGFEDGDEVLVAGSTHSPEEKYLTDIYREIRVGNKKVKFIVAPRHIERADSVQEYIEGTGLVVQRFSEIYRNPGLKRRDLDVVIVDTIGHLKNIYNAATVIFIGKSLVENGGGQNPIEAARWGKPVVFGKYMSNFREIADLFLENGAALEVSDKENLAIVLDRLFENGEERSRLGTNALKVIERNTGATARTAEKIKYIVVYA